MRLSGLMLYIKRQFEEIQQDGIITVLTGKFSKRLSLTLRLPIGGLTILLCYAIKPLIIIRFGHIYTSRIGHLCYNMDNYLADRHARNSNELAVFKTDSRISNESIYLIWRNKKNIIFTSFADYPLWFLTKFLPNSSLLISWQNELHPEYTNVSSTPSNINISEFDELECEVLLKENNISLPYICLHNRDPEYLNHYGSDGNTHDFRDFNFDDFHLGINQMTKSGIMCVRVGEKIQLEYKTNNKKFVSMTGLRRSDFSDVVLIKKCLFFVGCNTGFSNVSRIFRKPELLINYIPFRIHELSAWSVDSLIVPKKLYKIDERRYLRFAEIVSLSYDIHYQGDFFKENGLRVENNSQEEIADAIMEMTMRVGGKWKDSENQHQLQVKFWNSVAHVKYATEVRNQLGVNLSSTFLEKNPHLI